MPFFEKVFTILNKNVDKGKSFHYNIFEVIKMIPREHYIEQIRPFYDSDLIKIITGIRRCGKSVIMEQIIIYMYRVVNFIGYFLVCFYILI